MRSRETRRAAAGLSLSIIAGLIGGLFGSPIAHAETQQLKPIVITPSSGCGLLTAYTAGTGLPAWLGSPVPCGAGPFTLGFNQGNTPPSTLSQSGGVAMAGSALLAWFTTGVPDGARMGYRIVAPPGLTINKVVYEASQLQNIADGRGWIGFTYWNGGTAPVHTNGTAVDAAAPGPLNTTYWGVELRCVQSRCTWPGEIQFNSLTVYATQMQGPSITPVADPNSLWDQAGHWIWNAPGDPWALPASAADESGVCSLSVQAAESPPSADASLPAPNNSSWQECQQPVSWTAAVDTRDYVTGAGSMPLSLQATDAAGAPSLTSISETLNVDNDPVSVSLSTPDDPNPTVWVNHAVTVDATPSTGPSGLDALSCSVNGAAAQSYPAAGLAVDGDGVKTVTCTAWNNAFDPQGNHNSGTSSVMVHIDEAPPQLSLEPVNPNDPTAVVADTSDSESGGAGGSIEMAPAGTGSWTAVPTAFNGTQLVGHFDDAGLRDVYAFRARSCDNVGNCASITRNLALPVRDHAVSEVSLERAPTTGCSGTLKPSAGDPRAAGSLPRISEAGQAAASGPALLPDVGVRALRAPVVAAPILAGGTLAGGAAGRLTRSPSRPLPRARVAGARTQRNGTLHQRCSRPGATLAARANVPFGRAVTMQGLLMSSGGLPLADQPVAVLTAPDNGLNAFTQAAAVTTGPDGRWTATLPPGPSRIIRAVYPGSATVLPASGQAVMVVPAKIRIKISPRIVPWGSKLRITGRVLGGYVPTNSNLLRLNVGIGRIGHLEGLPKIDPDGRFVIVWKFNPGQGVLHPWFSVGTLSESAFPYAPGTSEQIVVTVGEPTPAAAGTTVVKHHRSAARHRGKHERRKRRRR